MIYLTDYIEDASIEREIAGNELVTFSDANIDEVRVEVLLVWHFNVDEAALARFPNLRAVVRYGVGFDNIDLQACQVRGIKVFNNPDYGVDEVSDTAIAMIMALTRNILGYNEVARDLVVKPNARRPWQENTNTAAKRLCDCALGIVGVGRIGSSVAHKMRRIVGDVHFFDPYVPSGYEKALRARRHDTLADLLGAVDIVSVHVPLSEATAGFIDASFVKKMRRGSILVNTARGGLLAELNFLSDALESGHLSGFGLDVLPEEPPIMNDSQRLLNNWLTDEGPFQGRVIINPHTSYYSRQSYDEMRRKAATIAVNASLDRQEMNRII